MVCLGNICRSPLAEGILQSKVAPERILVDSAGTGGWHVGNPPDPRSIAVARKHGLDISSQQCRQFRTDDFDKFDINSNSLKLLKHNLSILLKYTDLKIEIIAHTDARGNNVYNNYLSEKRALSTYNWLINNGIDRERITNVLFRGENELSNNCNDFTDCDENSHQLNRRAEFNIID